jgi:hypothetical protein
MIDRHELEVRLCTTIAPMLLAVAVFALGAAGSVTAARGTNIDELLFGAAFVSVLSSALLIDHLLDELAIPTGGRFFFLGGGYLLFSFVVAAAAALIPMQYHAKYHSGQMPSVALGIAVSAIGLCVFGKLMSYKDSNAFVVGIILSAAASGIILAS